MKTCNKILLIFVLSLYFSLDISAQTLKLYPTQPSVFGNKPMTAFTGGFQSTLVQSLDLNADGRNDLIFFDRSDKKVLTFLDTGKLVHAYEYAPRYEDAFSFIQSWFAVRDYNRDGLADIFIGNSGNMDVYKNITTGKYPQFLLVTSTLTDTVQIDPIGNPGLRANIYSDSYGLPAIEDMDGDGDLDILSLNILSTYIDYYRNMQVEASLPKDSLAYVRVDPCWGSIGISFSRNDADLGLSCEKVCSRHSAHSGSTFCMLDEDGDGDMEMLHGDVAYTNLAIFKNGAKEFSWKCDTIMATDTLFPRYDQPIDINFWPVVFYIDLDFDGKKDLFVSSNDSRMTRNVHITNFYKNIGTASKPRFKLTTYDFMGDKLFDIGSNSAPAFFDYDQDGDDDLIIGTSGDKNQGQNDSVCLLYLYQNIKTKESPEYVLVDTNWLNIRQYNIFPIIPAFGDLNGDGKKDLLIGNHNGKLWYFQNSGSALQFVTDTFENVDVGLYSSPSIADINGDGLNDFVVGSLYGNIRYYQNNGSASGSRFDLKTDSIGKIYTNYEYYDSVNAVWVIESEGMATPTLADINKDGKLDLLSGNLHGDVQIYDDISSHIYTKSRKLDSFAYNLVTDTFASPWFGRRTVPAVSLIDGDSFPDIILGNHRGGLHFLGTKRELKNQVDTLGIFPQRSRQEYTQVSVYPNPASDELNIVVSGSVTLQSYSIYNLMGQLISSGLIERSRTLVPLKELSSGMYILQINNKEGIYSVKFMKN